MGAIAGIIFFVFLLIVGIIGILSGIIGLIVCRKRKNVDSSFGKILTAVFTVILCISIGITLLPVGFFSFIILVNTLPPDGFVETDIIIEEDGYQDTRFTANGVVYEVTEYYVSDTEIELVPIFTYKTKGFMNGSQCGNYYEFETNEDFDLVCNEFRTIFCPVDKMSEFLKYYSDIENLTAYYDDLEGKRKELNEAEYDAVYGFLKNDLNTLEEQTMAVSNSETFTIELTGKDGVICTETHWFIIISDKVYYEKNSFYNENYRIEYTLIPLPKKLSDTLISIHNR